MYFGNSAMSFPRIPGDLLARINALNDWRCVESSPANDLSTLLTYAI